MTFDEFEIAYRQAFMDASKYKPTEVGFALYTDKMAQLNDDHPDWVEIIEERD